MIETEIGYRFYCQRPGCGSRSPALRETEDEAVSDQSAHDNIMHEHDAEPVALAVDGRPVCVCPGDDPRWRERVGHEAYCPRFNPTAQRCGALSPWGVSWPPCLMELGHDGDMHRSNGRAWGVTPKSTVTEEER